MNQTNKQIPCEIVSVTEGRTWNNIVVKRKVSNKRLFFGKATKDINVNAGDEAYLEIEAMPSEIPEAPLRVTLYDANGAKIDWTILQPKIFDVR